MATKWSITPPIREKILKKHNSSAVWSRTLTVMVVLAILSLVFIFIFLRLSTKNMEDNISRSLQHSVEQRQINIDFRLRSMQQLDENLITMIYPFTYSGVGLSDQYAEYAELNANLHSYTAHEDISNVRLYLSGDKIYSHQSSTYFPLDSLLRGIGETVPVYLERAGMRWLETHQIPLSKSPGGSQISTNVLTLVHSMRDRSDYSKLACVLMLDIEVSKFTEMLDSEDVADSCGYLVNPQGICLASPDQGLIRETVIHQNLMNRILQEKSGCVSDDGRVYVYQKLDHNDWYVVMDYPDSILSIASGPQGSILQIMITIVLVISLTLVFIVAYNYTVNVTLARINASLDALNTNENGDLENEVPQFLNPLHQLERNADQMVLTVKDLMESRYQDRIAIAESQMKSLQAQIKPHFLYNTLDIIKWMILDQRNEEAAQMVNSLSKYLRQSINKGPGIIPLREELELSRTYISIMQTRFKNRFTVNFEIEDAAELYMIPKLSLQPLLENALLHGILYCEKPEKELIVRAWVADDSVHIEVEDNGNGMKEETVQALEAGTAGYGLGNVRKRLALFSKNDGEFNIFSREGFGTCIAIRIPAVMQAPDKL